jgi:hypothetical protein
MADNQWYVIVNGTERGPLSSRQVKELVQVGQMTPTSKIRTAHSADYVDARHIRGLFPEQVHATVAPTTASWDAAPASPDPTSVSSTPADPPESATAPEDLFENFHAPEAHH